MRRRVRACSRSGVAAPPPPRRCIVWFSVSPSSPLSLLGKPSELPLSVVSAASATSWQEARHSFQSPCPTAKASNFPPLASPGSLPAPRQTPFPQPPRRPLSSQRPRNFTGASPSPATAAGASSPRLCRQPAAHRPLATTASLRPPSLPKRE